MGIDLFFDPIPRNAGLDQKHQPQKGISYLLEFFPRRGEAFLFVGISRQTKNPFSQRTLRLCGEISIFKSGVR